MTSFLSRSLGGNLGKNLKTDAAVDTHKRSKSKPSVIRQISDPLLFEIIIPQKSGTFAFIYKYINKINIFSPLI